MSDNKPDDALDKEREERYEGRSGEFDKEENLEAGPIKCMLHDLFKLITSLLFEITPLTFHFLQLLKDMSSLLGIFKMNQLKRTSWTFSVMQVK